MTYDVDQASLDASFENVESSMTQQNFKDECDINTIVRKFGVTGAMPVTPIPPQFGDFTGVSSYQEALNLIMQAQDVFDSVPAHIRKEFDNDPQAFVEFTTNPNNRSTLVDWGLVVDNPAPDLVPVSELVKALNTHKVAAPE